MQIELESTTKVVDVVVDGQAVPARVWEGRTASGVPVHAFVTRIAVHRDHDRRQFEAELEAELEEHRAPTNGDIEAYPNRLVL